MMTNPCKECIVEVMCREGCDSLIGYLDTALRWDNIGGTNLISIANGLREESLELFDNDTDWRSRFD